VNRNSANVRYKHERITRRRRGPDSKQNLGEKKIRFMDKPPFDNFRQERTEIGRVLPWPVGEEGLAK